MREMRTDSPNGRLDSWKEIATYLGRHERTVIRWEKNKKLPVHRVPGGERQAVFAYAAELDAWLRREQTQPQGLKPGTGTGQDIAALEQLHDPKADLAGHGTTEGRPLPIIAPSPNLSSSPQSVRSISFGGWMWKYYVLASFVIVGALFVLVFRVSSHTASTNFPVRVGFTLNSVQAFDETDHLLWSHTFSGALDPSQFGELRPLSSLAHIDDFREKGDREALIVAPVKTSLHSQDPAQTEVDLFSSRGELLWSYVPRGRFQFGKHDLNGPWVAMDLFVSSHEQKKQIWVAVTHAVWGNSFVVNLDPLTGKGTLRFVNTGTIFALNEIRTPLGDYLLAGGFNNESDTGSLAAINEVKPFAASPQSVGTRHKCLSCAAGDPDYYFEFARSEVNQLEQIHEDGVIQIAVTDDQVEIRKHELNGWAGPQMLYLLKADPGLRVVSLRFESAYDMLHRKFEQEGKIQHSLEECPERLHPRPIRVWTPAGGWQEIQLEPSRANE